MKKINGGVCAAAGSKAAGIHCGIRKNQSKRDLGLIVSDCEASAAAVYTTNLVKGAPLLVTKEHLANGKARAILCNSGNANTCNADGPAVARAMCKLAGDALGIAPEDVAVASTGVIGQPLSLAPIAACMEPLVEDLGYENSLHAAQAIMTTDTVPKKAAVEFELGGVTCRLGGIAKGSGMIHPNMATTLVFITTDAAISSQMLQKALSTDVQNTFNMVSIDGDTSTNDMVVILANGKAGNAPITAESEDFVSFMKALNTVAIDMGSGIGVNAFGACDEVWQKAVSEQAAKLQHTSNLYYTEPCARLAQALCERTGMKQVFFSNSGAEANECAIKVARKYGAEHLGPEHYTVLTLKNSFHGRTLATLAATGQDVFHKDFLPLTPGFAYVEAGDLEGAKNILDSVPCCAVLLETIQGEGGVQVMEPSFVAGLARLAAERGLLLMVDEVQTDNGRTGKLFGYMHYGLSPDVITTAKGLAGGLPLGATLLGGKAAGVLTPGIHGSTFGGNPVCCAGALTVLERLSDDFLAQVTAKGAWVRSQLEGAPGVVSVSGLGLMLGVETRRDAGEVLAGCQARGVLPLRAKNKVRLLPPLNIPDNLLAQAVQVLREECAKQI